MIESGAYQIEKWTEWENYIAKAIAEFVERNTHHSPQLFGG